jgi:hypothetical protein
LSALGTPRLELRLSDLDNLSALAELAVTGVHDPDVQPFVTGWTDVEPDRRARNVLQWHWHQLGRWSPEDWSLQLVAVTRGVVVGAQVVSCAFSGKSGAGDPRTAMVVKGV